MWVAKIILTGACTARGMTCKKFKIDCLAYPISSQVRKEGIYIYFSALLNRSNEKNKTQFFNSLSKNQKVIHLERKGDFIIGLIKECLCLRDLYLYDIVHIEPIHIRKDGSETWTVGCWEKADLIKFLDTMEKKFNAKLLQIKKENLSSVSIMHTHPSLTSKQGDAMRLAVENGYYNYPRKIDLIGLAKMMDVSYSTFQAHLRKAERQIMPFAFREQF